jgi:hypothetical protein
MTHLRRKKRFTSRESDYISSLSAKLEIVSVGSIVNPGEKVYIPGQTKQQGVPCPCCESTWTIITWTMCCILSFQNILKI